MVWTSLRRCYTWNLRCWVGGVETYLPARWYFCLPGALPFPGTKGWDSLVWEKPGEDNAVGEVWPQLDWDRGVNPGYLGQCYVGEHEWFRTAHLPAGILDP